MRATSRPNSPPARSPLKGQTPHVLLAAFNSSIRAPRGDTHGRVVGAMELREATDLIRHTLVLALIVSAPMLLIGLTVGIIVSLIQAVTQIQEQTLTFIPKIVAMVAAAILLMPWMSTRLIAYAAAMFTNSPLP